jgi:hypothetical protein
LTVARDYDSVSKHQSVKCAKETINMKDSNSLPYLPVCIYHISFSWKVLKKWALASCSPLALETHVKINNKCNREMVMGILTLEGLVSILQQQSQNTEKKFRSNKTADYCYNFKYMCMQTYHVQF